MYYISVSDVTNVSVISHSGVLSDWNENYFLVKNINMKSPRTNSIALKTNILLNQSLLTD